MRYLRRFNENLFGEEELQDFCETYLAYLLDDGFEVSVEKLYDHNRKESECTSILIRKSVDNKERLFYWSHVKDYIIPFITLLSKKYKLDRKRCIWFNGIKYYTYRDPFTQLGADNRKYGSETVRKTYTPKNIIDETLKFKDRLSSITIFIKKT